MRAIIFDMYGTLCKLENDPFKELLAGYAEEERRKIKNLLLTKDIPSVDDLSRLLRKDVRNYRKKIEEAVASVTLFPEVEKVLGKLKESQLKMGLISNLGSFYSLPFYNLGLTNYISFPVFSCYVGMRKPDERIYRLACEKLGVKPEDACMIGDSLQNDVIGAQKAGLSALHLNRSSHNLEILLQHYP